MMPCSWEYIEDLFSEREVLIRYPLRSNRDNRGWVLIFSGYTGSELACLASLPLFEPRRPLERAGNLLLTLPKRVRRSIKLARRALRLRRDLRELRARGKSQ